MSHSDVRNFLVGSVAALRDLPGAALDHLLTGAREISYEPHEAILEFGEEPTFLGILLDGKASASTLGRGAERTDLYQFQPGDLIGVFALMTGEKHTADVIATTRCRILQIPIPLFQSIIMTDANAVRALSRIITSRLQAFAADPARAVAAFDQNADPYGLQLSGTRRDRILVINCGSSSLKYCLFDTADDQRTIRGSIERIGLPDTRHKIRTPQGERILELPAADARTAFAAMVAALTDSTTDGLRSLSEVSMIGHRVVHGGERFGEAVVITDEIIRQLTSLNPLAPLHNPVNLAGIAEARRLFPDIPQVAVFDTAFHQTLPSYAYLYGLPYDLYERHRVRRYGFHGTSHQYVCLAAAQYLKRRPNAMEVVSCHLGNGASVCAVDHGRSVDTTMGFTPAEGLIMGTRSGDVDPGILTFLQRTDGLSGDALDDLINKRSGLLGLSGLSSDMREIETAADRGDHRALLALKTFSYRIRKSIGAYAAAMGGLDVVLFTGGIGQNSPAVRALALQGLECMGIHLDHTRNAAAQRLPDIARISTDDSPVTVLVVPTDEERMIAREARRAVDRYTITTVLANQQQQPILIEVSAHHVHLEPDHVAALFGPGHALRPVSDLSQPGQYAAKEQVNLIGPKGRVERVRILGPTRSATQVEISMTEQFKLGIHPPIRESGDLKGTPGITLEGPAGSVTIERGVICALRHIHMTPDDALRYGVKDKSIVRVRIPGDRELIFGDVLVRVSPKYKLAMHIDTDEANAANLKTGATGLIDGIQEQP